MTNISFIKMHGAGNDFVVIDNREAGVVLSEAQVSALADRRFGVGCDQLVILELPPTASVDSRSSNLSSPLRKEERGECAAESGARRVRGKADTYMRIFNADGSQIDACGNASRCAAWLLMEEKGEDEIILQTGAGLLICVRAGAHQVCVNMGEPLFEWNEIPLAERRNSEHLGIAEGALMDPMAVNIGNPHAVFFVGNVEAIPLEKLGPTLEHHPLFPERANISAAQILDERSIKLRVWERGAGQTLACGTAACATLVAAVKRGLIGGRSATIELPGGVLDITWREDNNITMTGPVAEVFRGEITL